MTMPLPTTFEHTGAIGGLLAGKAWRTEQDQAEAETAKTKFELAQEQGMVDAMRAASGELAQIESPAERLMKQAEIVGEFQPDTAADMLAKAAMARENEAQAAGYTLANEIVSANAAASLLGSVTDGASLRALHERTQIQGYDSKGVIPMLFNEYIENGWTPHLEKAIAMARQQIISARDKAQIALDEERARTERSRQATEKVKRETLIPAQADAVKALAAQRRKAGDKPTKASMESLNASEAYISSKYDYTSMEDEGEKAELALRADELKERTDEVLRNSPGTSREVARRQAFRQMENEGAFVGRTVRPAGEGTPDNPMELPINKKGSIAAKKLVVNKVYRGFGDYEGMALQWTGSTFRVVGNEALVGEGEEEIPEDEEQPEEVAE